MMGRLDCLSWWLLLFEGCNEFGNGCDGRNKGSHVVWKIS